MISVIADERVEVRMAAQGALSGLIHCGLIDVTDEMLTKAKETLRDVARRIRERREQRRAMLEAKHSKTKEEENQNPEVIPENVGPPVCTYGDNSI